MRILIHALSLREYGGTERHMRLFLPALAAYSPEVNYVLYVNTDFRIANSYDNIKVVRVPVRNNLERLWWDQVELRKQAIREKVSGIWCMLGFGTLRPPVPQVMFQRGPIYYCRYYLDMIKGTARFEILLRRWLQLGIMHASNRVVTPTHAMRDMILSIHPELPKTKFQVIPHAYDEAITAETEPPPALVRELITGFSNDTLIVLYAGHILPYKQLDLLLESFQRVVLRTQQPLRLLLTIAREDWPAGYEAFCRQIQSLGLQESVKVIGKIPQGAMGYLYRRCHVVAFPSLCESFGWPLLEATSLRVPLLAADTPLNREMAGAGALYFTPGQVESAAEKLNGLLIDPTFRARVGIAGRAYFESTHLTWPEYVKRCLDVTGLAAP